MVRKTGVLILLLVSVLAWAKKVPPVPTDRRWVQDYANVLESDQELFLLRKLKAYYDSTSTEVVIVTENSLEGADIFDYSYRLAENWGIGGKAKNNGVLIYAAILDRKVFIQVGRGAEGALPDIYAKRIVENQLKPNFKNKQYGKGFNEATDVVIKRLEGEFVSDGRKGPKKGMPQWLIVLSVIIAILLFSSGGNNGQTFNRPGSNRGMVPPIWLGGGSRRGGGFGGGGFGGGFGGGSFGGGGAGGSW